MYITRVVPIRKVISSLALSICCFSNKSSINKVSLYFQRAKLIDSIRLALHSNDSSSLNPLLCDPSLDSFVVANALRSAPSIDSVLSLIEALKAIPHFRHNQHTLYALAKVLAKNQQSKKLKALINAINSRKFQNVPRVGFMEAMRLYSIAGDLDSVLDVWEKCRALERRLPVEAYNILMRIYAHIGNNSEAVKVFYLMIGEGLVPDCRTYTVMIEHLVILGKLGSAMEVFSMLPMMRIKRTLIQYSLLMEAFVGADDFEMAKVLLNEMKIEGKLPGRAMLWALQRMHKAGYIEETDDFIQGLLPDERIDRLSFMKNDDHNNDGDDDNDTENANVSGIQLKRWLDPSALASALRCWEPDEVSTLEDAELVWTPRLVCKMIRSFKSADTASKFFCWVANKPGFSHEVFTLSRIICKLAQSGYIDLVDDMFVKVKTERIRLSFTTITAVIDSYGVHKKGEEALKTFREVETLCGSITKTQKLLLYKSLSRTLAKCEMNSHVLDIVDEMILGGIEPDIQTFTELMHHFAFRGDIKVVQRLFSMVKQRDIKPDAYMFQMLIRDFCKCDRAVLALRVFGDMQNAKLMPDIATKQVLVKSLWKEGKFREAASVEERSEQMGGTLPLGLRSKFCAGDLRSVCRIYCESFAAPSSQNN